MGIIQAITDKDIKRYQAWMAKDPTDGANRMYDDLSDKGFASAAWARNEHRLDSNYGATNVVYFNHQNNTEIDKTEVNQLYTDIAKSTLAYFEGVVKNEGSVKGDLTYKISSAIRHKVYKVNGYDGTQWLFDVPMQVQIGEKGEAVAESIYQSWISDGNTDNEAIREAWKTKVEEDKSAFDKALPHMTEDIYGAPTYNGYAQTGMDDATLASIDIYNTRNKMQEEVIKTINNSVTIAASTSVLPEFYPKTVEEAQDIVNAIENGETTSWGESWKVDFLNKMQLFGFDDVKDAYQDEIDEWMKDAAREMLQQVQEYQIERTQLANSYGGESVIDSATKFGKNIGTAFEHKVYQIEHNDLTKPAWIALNLINLNAGIRASRSLYALIKSGELMKMPSFREIINSFNSFMTETGKILKGCRSSDFI